ncbi:hypothetical protein KDH_28430 [Dictyobacter sp. S3.2.2.5]|uniref:Uncharacterized protein n=1 Tax=Dictyobacter halimunensis TaxID=3026934 RepID=A0ABQ6FNZ6_9CHLR|nr:hypothetical protein KDH_28430 [Dictyobacter sp. S3.2.2.5]
MLTIGLYCGDLARETSSFFLHVWYGEGGYKETLEFFTRISFLLVGARTYGLLGTSNQAMPLPRSQHVDAELQRIVTHVLTSFPDGIIHTAQLATFLHAHVEP